MPGQKTEILERVAIQKSAALYRALAHPLRWKIIELLMKNGTLGADKIYTELKLSESSSSQHLRILREQNLILASRLGKNVSYVPNRELISKITSSTSDFFSGL